MLKLFQFSGPDSSSDDNYFTFLLYAHNKRQAQSLAREHLRSMGRDDLIPAMEYEILQPATVIYSNVQRRV